MSALATDAVPFAAPAAAPRAPVPWWGWLLAGALIFAAAIGGVVFSPPGSEVAVWWPATGIAVGFLLLQPRGRIPAALALVLAVSLAAHATAGRSLGITAAFGVINTVEVAVTLGVLGAWRRPFRLSSLQAGLRFALAAAAGATTAGVLAGITLELIGQGGFLPAAPFVAASHAAAVLMIAPFAALPPRLPVRASAPEMVLQATLLALALAAVFHPGASLPLTFMLYPFLAWAAFRFPIRLVLAESLIASLVMLAVTVSGGGPFSAEGLDLTTGAALLEVLLVTFAGFAVVLTAAQYELRAVSRQLDASALLLGGGLVDARIGLAIAEPTDGGTRLVWANRAARRLLASELDAADAWTGPIAVAAARALRDGEQATVTAAGVRTITVAANAVEGDEQRFAVQLLDVTSILRAQQARVEAEVERESARTIRAELERQRDDFLATTSHELRTPITSIVGYAELLSESEGMSQQQRGWLDVVDRNAHRLSELVEDLLTLSRGSAARGRPQHRESIRCAELLAEVVANLRVMSDPKRLEVVIDAPDATVLASRSDVLRAVTNLLVNAIKFTPEGGRIRLSAGDGDEGDAVLLAVADTGPGMTDEEIAQAFERFYRAPGAERANVAGTGLGLAIVAELARRNGGDVAIRRNDDGGITALLRLPPGD